MALPNLARQYSKQGNLGRALELVEQLTMPENRQIVLTDISEASRGRGFESRRPDLPRSRSDALPALCRSPGRAPSISDGRASARRGTGRSVFLRATFSLE